MDNIIDYTKNSLIKTHEISFHNKDNLYEILRF